MKPSSIVATIVAAIAGLGAVAYWDDGREAAASLEDFGQEQALLAREVAASMLAASRRSGFDGAAIRDVVAPIEEAGAVVALLRAPGGTCLGRPSGGEVCMPRIQAAIDGVACSVESARTAATCSLRLSRDESVSVGLPPRTGMAGVATFIAPDGARHGVAIVATAARERDRERRAAARIVLSFVVASGLVLAFGSLALRKQRRELALAAELAVAAVGRANDERLMRADKLATLGALATGIAHEVATPLGVIVGRAEQLAAKVAGDARAVRSVAAILEQAGRIDEIIRAFLTLARGGTPSLEHADPRDVVRCAIDLVLHRFAQCGVDVTNLAGDEVPMIACERRLLEQALVNLLLNACDACSAGGHVWVAAYASDAEVALVVTDDGAGITEQTAARATEPFFTTKPEGKGTGLGLAITREIVQHHRGRFEVRPRHGVPGTEARITLPQITTP
jgi:signal transduction histidine kinase